MTICCADFNEPNIDHYPQCRCCLRKPHIGRAFYELLTQTTLANRVGENAATGGGRVPSIRRRSCTSKYIIRATATHKPKPQARSMLANAWHIGTGIGYSLPEQHRKVVADDAFSDV